MSGDLVYFGTPGPWNRLLSQVCRRCWKQSSAEYDAHGKRNEATVFYACCCPEVKPLPRSKPAA